MKPILDYIEEKKRELDESPFVMFMRDRSIDPRDRFAFAPCMAPFVMAFADINKYLLRDEQSRDSIQRIINAHTEEDDHHTGMYLMDLATLGLNESQELTSTLKFLWGEERKKTRQVVYGLTALTATAHPKMRLVIVEAIEAAGNVAFNRYSQAAREYAQVTGKRLLYFGDLHLGLESGHAMGTQNVESLLAQVELTPQEEQEARGLVDRAFMLFREMGDEFVDYAQRHILVQGKPQAAPSKSTELQVR